MTAKPVFSARSAIAAAIASTLLLLAGCATNQKPVLYPNAHLKNVGDATAQRDIHECIEMAENSGVAKSNNQVLKGGAQGAAVGGAAAAVGNAINDALAPLGAEVCQQPFTPERILRALGRVA